jgi:cell division protein FtsQ
MRRVSPRNWRLPAFFAGLALVGVAALAAGGWWLHSTGGLDRIGERLLAVTASGGLAVTEIEVEGRSMTSRDSVLRAIGASRGTPILATSPARIKAELEAMPWIRSASVERLFPDTLSIRLVERQPFALWQSKGKLALIDRDGVVTTAERLERWASLPMVVGEDAASHAAEIVDVLATEPELAKRVSAAVRVGGRRWNLKMDNGIEIQLPEQNPGAAWAQLAKLERLNNLLARNVETVDLRLPDRLVVRTVPEPPKETPKKGKQKNT